MKLVDTFSSFEIEQLCSNKAFVFAKLKEKKCKNN